MKKYIQLPLVVALSATVVACDTTEQTPSEKISQRDVYNSLEDCVADWGDQELCESQMKEAREHAEKMAAANASHGGSSVVVLPMFFGPEYSGSRSYTNSSGRTITPVTNNTSRTATYATNLANGSRAVSYFAGPKNPPGVSLPTTRSPVASTSVSRGGFGSTGSSSSSSGG